jgi:hypothetical protein
VLRGFERDGDVREAQFGRSHSLISEDEQIISDEFDDALIVRIDRFGYGGQNVRGSDAFKSMFDEFEDGYEEFGISGYRIGFTDESIRLIDVAAGVGEVRSASLGKLYDRGGDVSSGVLEGSARLFVIDSCLFSYGDHIRFFDALIRCEGLFPVRA